MATKPVEGTQPAKAKSHRKTEKPNFEIPKETVFEAAERIKKSGNCTVTKVYYAEGTPQDIKAKGNISPKSDFFKPVSGDGEELIMCKGGAIKRYSSDDIHSVLYGKPTTRKSKATEDTVTTGSNPELESKIIATGECRTEKFVDKTDDSNPEADKGFDFDKFYTCDGGQVSQYGNDRLDVIEYKNPADPDCNDNGECNYYNFEVVNNFQAKEIEIAECRTQNSKPCK